MSSGAWHRDSLYILMNTLGGGTILSGLSQRRLAVRFLVLLVGLSTASGWADDARSPPSAEVCVIFTGDLMHHCSQSSGARLAAGGDGYDFRPTFAHVATLFEGADLVVGNLETPIDGRLDEHCFPRFSAPVEYLDALRDAGFDVLSLANNHALDRGSPGLARTVERIRTWGMAPVGVAPDFEHQVVAVEGLEVVFLAATRVLNFPCRSDPCPVVIPRRGDPEGLLETVQAQAASGRAVVVLLHWMDEYQERPRRSQRILVKALVDAGAMAVIGAHSHVLGPAEFVAASSHRRGYVRYSLGNLVHAMKRFPVKLGGLDKVCFQSGPEGPSVTRVEFTPTYVRRNAGTAPKAFQPISLEAGLRQCAEGDGPFPGLTSGECSEMRTLMDHLESNSALRGAD